MKKESEIREKLMQISTYAQDGDNPENIEHLAQEEILEWVLS